MMPICPRCGQRAYYGAHKHETPQEVARRRIEAWATHIYPRIKRGKACEVDNGGR